MIFIVSYYLEVFKKQSMQIVMYFGDGFLFCNHDPVAEFQF
jgi:hypothetical protein